MWSFLRYTISVLFKSVPVEVTIQKWRGTAPHSKGRGGDRPLAPLLLPPCFCPLICYCWHSLSDQGLVNVEWNELLFFLLSITALATKGATLGTTKP